MFISSSRSRCPVFWHRGGSRRGAEGIRRLPLLLDFGSCWQVRIPSVSWLSVMVVRHVVCDGAGSNIKRVRAYFEDNRGPVSLVANEEDSLWRASHGCIMCRSLVPDQAGVGMCSVDLPDHLEVMACSWDPLECLAAGGDRRALHRTPCSWGEATSRSCR